MINSEIRVSYRRGAGTFRLISLMCFCFLAGMAFQSSRSRALPVQAASDHLYELMIYHTIPGKAPALESVFQGASKLQARHGLQAVGYWIPKDNSPAWRDTFIYLLAHSDRQSAERNWNALHADPAFEPFFKAAAPLIQQRDGNYLVDEVYMSPTAYSYSK